MTVEKMPWWPLERIARIPIRHGINPTRGDWARAFNVERQTIDRWRRVGIPWDRADEIAVRALGIHPGCIWLEWWHR